MNRRTFKWSHSELISLISLYEDRSNLYDIHHVLYHNRDERIAAMKSLTREMQKIKPEITMQDCKTKLRSLRVQYARDKLCIEKSKVQNDKNEYQPKLWCYDRLTFLSKPKVPTLVSNSKKISFRKDIYINKNMNSNNCSNISGDDGELILPDEMDTDVTQDLSRNEEDQTPTESSLEFNTVATLITAKKWLSKNAKPTILTKEDIFGNFVGSELKRIRNIARYNQVTWQIQSIIHDALESEEESDNSSTLRQNGSNPVKTKRGESRDLISG